MTKRKEKRGEKEQPPAPSLAYRLGSHFTIAVAIVITDFGVALTVDSGAETAWGDVAWMAVHALAIGTVVFLWLPLSAWLARRIRLSEAAVEGLMVLGLGLLVAGVEFGLLRGPGRVAHTVVAVVGMLAGWAMRIPPPQPKRPARRK
jgi:hypothetical protein